MKITTTMMNVGTGEGNWNLVFEVLWFVEVFIILNFRTNDGGEYVENENHEYEIVLSVKIEVVEVYIRAGMVGWITIESH